MRITLFALSIAALNVIGIGQERAPLHVLYIGEANKKERTGKAGK